MGGVLYVVSTPIGNAEDITLRALRTLREVDLIAAEDSRITRRLLERHGIVTELCTYRARAQRDPTEMLTARLQAGARIALVCDAGTPLIADPGARLIAIALACDLPVVPVPGPVAALAALAISGLPTQRFVFEGFPPRSRTDRQTFFAALALEPRTLLLYETRSHLRSTLETLQAILGPERRIVVAQDLTTPTERLYRGALAEICARLLPTPPRGEYTLVVAGKECGEKK